MSVDPRLKAQIDLILRDLQESEAYPPNWQDTGEVDYLYRRNTILVREQDEARVTDAVVRILQAQGGHVPEGPNPFDSRPVVGSVRRLTLPSAPAEGPLSLPRILDSLDRVVEPGTARLEHIAFVCPHTCPATEPMQVPPGPVNPLPPPGLNERCCRRDCVSWPTCDGDGVFISIVDTGFVQQAATGHPWLAGAD